MRQFVEGNSQFRMLHKQSRASGGSLCRQGIWIGINQILNCYPATAKRLSGEPAGADRGFNSHEQSIVAAPRGCHQPRRKSLATRGGRDSEHAEGITDKILWIRNADEAGKEGIGLTIGNSAGASRHQFNEALGLKQARRAWANLGKGTGQMHFSLCRSVDFVGDDCRGIIGLRPARPASQIAPQEPRIDIGQRFFCLPHVAGVGQALCLHRQESGPQRRQVVACPLCADANRRRHVARSGNGMCRKCQRKRLL